MSPVSQIETVPLFGDDYWVDLHNELVEILDEIQETMPPSYPRHDFGALRMPYVKSIKSEKITLPSDSHYFVMWRLKVRYGDMKQATTKSVTMDPRSQQADFNAAAYTEYAVLAHIAEWNLDDEKGEPLPVTVESLGQLDEEDMNLLLSKLSTASTEQETERKK